MVGLLGTTWAGGEISECCIWVRSLEKMSARESCLHFLCPTIIVHPTSIANIFPQRQWNLNGAGNERLCRRNSLECTNESFGLPLRRIDLACGLIGDKRGQCSL